MSHLKKLALIFLCLGSGIIFLQATEFYEKKLIVVNSEAKVYLDPDSSSPVIGLLPRGTIVYQASDRLFRKIWKYIYYNPGDSEVTKSGYVLAKDVRALFKVTKVYTIHGQRREKLSRQFPPGYFRYISWGMSPDELIAIEGKPIYNEEKEEMARLDYYIDYGGVDGLLSYYFLNGQLTATQFSVRTLPRRYSWISLYRNIRDFLIEKLGQTKNENQANLIAIPMAGTSSNSDKIALDLNLESRWETDRTRVILRLAREESGLALEVRAECPLQLSVAKDI